jgi:hypothetical protein
MGFTPATNRQVPDHSIMDHYNKQTYLGNKFVYASNQAIASTSEIPLLLLQNPAVATSSFPSGYTGLFVDLMKLAVITASQSAVIRVYLNPTTPVAGTAKTPTNLRYASATTSIAALSAAPTVSGNGTLINVLSALPGQPDRSDLLVILDPGQNMLLTIQATANPTTIAQSISWYEL